MWPAVERNRSEAVILLAEEQDRRRRLHDAEAAVQQVAHRAVGEAAVLRVDVLGLGRIVRVRAQVGRLGRGPRLVRNLAVGGIDDAAAARLPRLTSRFARDLLDADLAAARICEIVRAADFSGPESLQV